MIADDFSAGCKNTQKSIGTGYDDSTTQFVHTYMNMVQATLDRRWKGEQTKCDLSDEYLRGCVSECEMYLNRLKLNNMLKAGELNKLPK